MSCLRQPRLGISQVMYGTQHSLCRHGTAPLQQHFGCNYNGHAASGFWIEELSLLSTSDLEHGPNLGEIHRSRSQRPMFPIVTLKRLNLRTLSFNHLHHHIITLPTSLLTHTRRVYGKPFDYEPWGTWHWGARGSLYWVGDGSFLAFFYFVHLHFGLDMGGGGLNLSGG